MDTDALTAKESRSLKSGCQQVLFLLEGRRDDLYMIFSCFRWLLVTFAVPGQVDVSSQTLFSASCSIVSCLYVPSLLSKAAIVEFRVLQT